MFDMHTHTTLSDGALIPAELIRRAEVAGYAAFAITDHVDLCTVETIVPRLVEAAQRENELGRMVVVPGAEVTHVRPCHIAECTARARELGALLVLCHGETLAEPVESGTNRAAILAGVDIVAHPGLIGKEEVELAAARNVALELTAKNGHCYTNGHVAKLALAARARLTFGSDGHTPEQLKTRGQALQVLRGAGLSEDEAAKVLSECERVLRGKNTGALARQEPV